MSINAIVSNLWVVILTCLPVVVCNLQDVNCDSDHRELMASFLPVNTAKWIGAPQLGEPRSRREINAGLLSWKYGLKYKSMGLSIASFNLLGCRKINKAGDYYLWMLFLYKATSANILETTAPYPLLQAEHHIWKGNVHVITYYIGKASTLVLSISRKLLWMLRIPNEAQRWSPDSSKLRQWFKLPIAIFMPLGKIELQDPEPWPQISEKRLGFISEDRSSILCCVLCATFHRYCRGGGNGI